jgi:uncharacterized protein YutE (UPF0331/DUF86 family)
MASFGDDFDLRPFKEAFNTAEDLEAYNRVQAVERAVGRLQNFVAALAEAGTRLAALPRRSAAKSGSAADAFEALRDAGVIDRALCRRLIQAQHARSMIEHSYVQIPAGDVHRAATLVRRASREFIAPFRVWVATYIDGSVVDSG